MKKIMRTLLYVLCSCYLAYSILQNINWILLLSSYKNVDWTSIYFTLATTAASMLALICIITTLFNKALRNKFGTIGSIIILYGSGLTTVSIIYLGGTNLPYYYDDAITYCFNFISFISMAMLILGAVFVTYGCIATVVKNNRIKKQGLQQVTELQEEVMSRSETLRLAVGALIPLIIIISVFSYQLRDRLTIKTDQPVSFDKNGVTLSFTQPANTKMPKFDDGDTIFINVDSSATHGCRINIKTGEVTKNTQSVKNGKMEDIDGKTFYHSQYTTAEMEMNSIQQAQTYTIFGQKNYIQIQYYSGECNNRGGDMSEQLDTILRTLEFKD